MIPVGKIELETIQRNRLTSIQSARCHRYGFAVLEIVLRQFHREIAAAVQHEPIPPRIKEEKPET